MGPSNIHLELSGKCVKECPACQRRVAEIEAPDEVRSWDYMDMALVERLADELPHDILLSLHGRGEPLQHPHIGQCLEILSKNNRILHFDSNIMFLDDKGPEIIDRLDVLTVSLLEGNSHDSNMRQYRSLNKFLKLKKGFKPRVVIRITGTVPGLELWEKLGLPLVKRPLHSKQGRSGYSRPPVAPEFHICLEMLQRLFIAYNGEVRPCVRSDIWGENIIGDLNHETLNQIWTGIDRSKRLQEHVRGERLGFCADCQFWGIPNDG